MTRKPADNRHPGAAIHKPRSGRKRATPKVKPGTTRARDKKPSALPSAPQRRPAHPKPFW
jgi:hypothetical protein